MPTTKLNDFSVERIEILSSDGSVDKDLMPKIKEKDILGMYRGMVITRLFDSKAVSLQRQGRIGTYGSSLGQEASIIGPSYVLGKEDWLVPSFREVGAMLLRGVPLYDMLQYWRGEERGSEHMAKLRILPVAIPVSTQILHAVGIGWAMRKKGKKAIALTSFGDGATSKGDFYEGMNLAGVFKAQVVFWCQNNQYAISLPVSKQTIAESLAQKAIAAGIHGIQVDGNDIFAVYVAAKQAVADARTGKPTLIESLTYRLADHTTSDDSSRYRLDKEVKAWAQKDPIDRLEKYMRAEGMLDDALKEKILKKEVERLKKAVSRLEESPLEPDDIFMFTYAERDEALEEQFREFRQYRRNRGGE